MMNNISEATTKSVGDVEVSGYSFKYVPVSPPPPPAGSWEEVGICLSEEPSFIRKFLVKLILGWTFKPFVWKSGYSTTVVSQDTRQLLHD